MVARPVRYVVGRHVADRLGVTRLMSCCTRIWNTSPGRKKPHIPGVFARPRPNRPLGRKPVTLLSFCGNRPRLWTTPMLPWKSSVADGAACTFDRMLTCRSSLGRYTWYAGGVPASAVVSR